MKALKDFLIYVNSMKDSDKTLSNQLADVIKRAGGTAKIATGDQDTVDEHIREDLINDRDAIIVLGGDGTMLRVAYVSRSKKLPMIGVNLGTVGFLAEVEDSRMEEMVDRLMAGDYKVDEKMILSGSINGENYMAVNDIVVYRSGKLRVIAVKLYVNDVYYETYTGDGVIISTPTGSTAYNLSVGGPLVAPNAKVVIIAPVAPHSLTGKTFVFSAEDKITVEIEDKLDIDDYTIEIAFDALENKRLYDGDRCDITVSNETIPFLTITDRNFYDILRHRINRRNR
ncbi:MAG: NAD(+)/NADH kinase [Eubacterium sp.]|nr:NAD(+)/NADH kinase [Eubacterium sp.]